LGKPDAGEPARGQQLAGLRRLGRPRAATVVIRKIGGGKVSSQKYSRFKLAGGRRDAIRLPLGALRPSDACIVSGSVMLDQSMTLNERA
jgi:hypothetical protein